MSIPTLTLDHLALLIDHRNNVISSLQAIGAKRLTRFIELKALGLMEDREINDITKGIAITEKGTLVLAHLLTEFVNYSEYLETCR